MGNKNPTLFNRSALYYTDRKQEYEAFCVPIINWDQKTQATTSYLQKNPQDIPQEDLEKALSIVITDHDFGDYNPDDPYTAIILVNGMRAGNYDKKGRDPSFGTANAWGIRHFVDDIDKRPGRYRVYNVLVAQDGRLELQSEFIAKWISRIMQNKDCKEVKLLGMSKGGRMVPKILKYLERTLGDDKSLDAKMDANAYGMTGGGTVFANSTALFNMVTEVMNNANNFTRKAVTWAAWMIKKWTLNDIKQKVKEFKGPSEELDKLVDVRKRLSALDPKKDAQSIFQISYDYHTPPAHMDADIADPNYEFSPELEAVCDRNFLRFDEAEKHAIARFGLRNFVPTFTTKMQIEALKQGNWNSVLLAVSARLLFRGKPSDGMNPVESAEVVENLGIGKGITHVGIDGSHDIGSTPGIISIVNDEIIREPTQELKPVSSILDSKDRA